MTSLTNRPTATTIGVLAALGVIALLLYQFGSLSANTPVEETKERRFSFSYQVRLPKIPAEAKTVEVILPCPSSDDQQTITAYRISSNLNYTEYIDPEYGNSTLIFKSEGAFSEKIDITLDISVIRREVAPLKSTEPFVSATPGSLKRYLQADSLVPLDGAILQEARSVVDEDQSSIDKARSIYDHLFNTMTYDKSGSGWGNGDVLFACDTRRGNCTDIHSLFIALARASGVPARFVIGFPLPEDEVNGAISGYHCWAEFYDSQRGWIPVDISEAIKHPEKKNDYFGWLDPDRVSFTTGRDILIHTSHGIERLNYFIYPLAFVDGEPFTGLKKSFSFSEG